MDFFLQDPNEVRLPPEEVRLLDLQVAPQPNGRQVKVYLELTPFRKRPNIEVTVYNASGNVAGRSSILEAMQRKLEFTLHLRQPEPGGKHTIECVVYYQKLPEPTETPVEVELPEPMVVDRRKETFIAPAASA